MVVGLREIEATRHVIQDLRRSGAVERADAVEAVLTAATDGLAVQPGGVRHDLLTTGQAARALGVSLQTVKNWADAGHFPLVRLGGRQFVHRRDLMGYLEDLGAEQRRDAAVAEPPWFRRPDGDAETRLPPRLVERAHALHTRIEADRELSGTEKAELADVEKQLAAAAADRLCADARRPRA